MHNKIVFLTAKVDEVFPVTIYIFETALSENSKSYTDLSVFQKGSYVL